MKTVHSQLFKIVRLTLMDAENLNSFLITNKERFAQYFPVTLSLNKTLPETQIYIEDCENNFNAKTLFVFGIKEIASENIIGLLILKKIDWGKFEGEFAFCIDKDFEGKGLTTWGVNEMVNFASDNLGLQSLRIIAHKTNLASCGVAKKNGFLWQETLRAEFKPSGAEAIDMELFVLKK